jgi:hypothetical protein
VGRAAVYILTALTSAALIAGCGGSDDGSGTRDRPAPAAAEFPPASGQSLGEVLSASSGEGPVVSPGQRVLRQGENRFAFGVFTLGHDQIDDAQVALYAAPGVGLKGPAIGPFPAKIIDLTTEPSFRAKTTSDDPEAAQVAYVSQVPLDKPGAWTFGALVKEGDTYKGSLLATPSTVGEFNPPSVGDKAPVVHTPTADEVSDISQIDTRVPPDDMHNDDLADVLGKKPVVLLFATPALCQSRVCGPVVDIAEQVKAEGGEDVEFIHMEVFRDNQIEKGIRPQLAAWSLQSEPWLFTVDGNGRVAARLEGAYSERELREAIEKATG